MAQYMVRYTTADGDYTTPITREQIVEANSLDHAEADDFIH
jgi:hypothetical protein